MTPAEINWFETNFCLRLQIDKNPDQVVSADFNQLLSGGTRRGIYTAEDVAREQAAEQSGGPNLLENHGRNTGDLEAATNLNSNHNHLVNVAEVPATTPLVHSKPTSGSSRFSGAPKGKGSFS